MPLLDSRFPVPNCSLVDALAPLPAVLSLEACLQTAIALLAQPAIDQVGCVAVVEQSQFVGLVTPQSVMAVLAQGVNPIETAVTAAVYPSLALPWDDLPSIEAALGQMEADRVTVLPVLDRQGQLRGVVTETGLLRQQQQQLPALKQRDRTSSVLLDAIPDLIFQMRRDGTYLSCAAPDSFNLVCPLEQMNVRRLDEILPPPLAQERMHYVERAFATGEVQVYEYQIEVNGESLDEEARIAVCGTDEVVTIVRDITARKRAERALRASEMTNRTLLAAIPDLIIRMNRDGVYLDFLMPSDCKLVRPLQEQLGYRTEEVLPVELAIQRMEHIEQALLTGTVQTFEYQLNCGGELIDEETRIVPITPDEVVLIARDISDRKRTERALRDSERRYATLAEAAPVGIYRSDAQGQCVYLNERCCQITGLSAEAALGDQWNCHLYPDDREAVFTGWARTVESGQPFRAEYRFQRPDSSVIWVYGQAVAERNEQGEIVGFIGTLTDITAQKQAELALRQSEERFSKAFHATPMGISITRYSDGTVLDVNESFLKGKGYRRDELIGRTSVELQLFPDNPIMGRIALLQYLEHPPAWGIEQRCRAKDGSMRDLRLYLERLELAGEDCLLILSEDITEYKQMQAELRQREQEFHALVDNAPDVITRIDSALRYAYVNPVITQVTGLPPQSFIGKTDAEVGILGEVVADWQNTLRQVFASGQEDVFEFDFSSPRGDLFYQARVVPEFGPTGEVVSVLSIARDITQRRVAERALQQLNQELEQRVAQRTEALLQSQMALRSSQERLQYLLTTSPTITYSCGLGTADLSTFMSDSVEKVLGYTPECFFNERNFWFSHVHPQDQPRVINTLNRLMQGKNVTVTYRFLHANGSYRWMEDCKQIVCDEAGQPIEIVGSWIDIHDRKQAELERDRFFNNALDIMLIIDVEGYFRQINPAWEEVTGFSIADSVGRHFSEFIHPEDLTAADKILQDSLMQGEPLINYENRYRHREGSYRWLLWSKFLVQEEGLIYAFARDVTDRHLARAALQESEALFRAISERMPDALFLIDLDDPQIPGKILYVNDAACRMHRCSPEDLLGQPVTVMDAPATAAQAEERINRILAGETLVFEAEHIRPDGSHYEIEVSACLLMYQGRRVMLAIDRDITDRKQVEAQIRATLQQRELMLKEVHHRVKNNLQVVSSLLSLQSQSVQDKATRQLFVDSQNRVRAISLIHNLLYQSRDLNRIEVAAYIPQLVQQLVSSYRVAGPGCSIRLSIEPLFLNLDTVLPCGLLINELVSNTFKYAFPPHWQGDRQLWIEWHVVGDDRYQLTVGDNGVGLPKEFNFRRPNSLGLQLVCDLAYQIKGEITQLPQPGTCFQMTFAEVKYKSRL